MEELRSIGFAVLASHYRRFAQYVFRFPFSVFRFPNLKTELLPFGVFVGVGVAENAVPADLAVE